METLNEPEVTPTPAGSPKLDRLARAIERMRNRTSEEIQAARERIWAKSPPPRPLPEGKTLEDVVQGTWPGNETDEEILEMLERLS